MISTLRARFVHALAIGLVAGFIGGAAAPAVTSAAPSNSPDAVSAGPRPTGYATDVQSFINAYRRRAGVAPVAQEWRLNQAAQTQANDMARRRVLTHAGSDGASAGTRISRTGYRWSIWGENVAAGQTTASQVVWAWLNSPSHRAVMLDRRFKHMGLGRAVASNGTVYWSLVLASPA